MYTSLEDHVVFWEDKNTWVVKVMSRNVWPVEINTVDQVGKVSAFYLAVICSPAAEMRINDIKMIINWAQQDAKKA